MPGAAKGLTPNSARLSALLDREGAGLHAMLLKLTLRRDVAVELFHELFVKLAAAEGFATARDPAAYAYRSAIHVAMDWRRRRRSTTDADLAAIADDAEPAAISRLIVAEEVARLPAALSELSELARDAICMRYLMQMSFQAVGAALDRSAHQARALCHDGLRQLRQRLVVERRLPALKGQTMNTPNRRTIHEALAIVAVIEPTPADHAAAVEAVSRQISKLRQRRWRAVATLTAIAAGVVIGLLILNLPMRANNAAATERLEAIFDAAAKFDGWVSIRTPGEAKPHTIQQVKDGTRASWITLPDDRHALWIDDRAERMQWVWLEGHHEVVGNDSDPLRRPASLSVDADGRVAYWRQQWTGTTVRSRREGPYEIFDVAIRPRAADDGAPGPSMGDDTIWVDVQSQQIVRTVCTYASRDASGAPSVQTSLYTYEPDSPKTLFDLGVPRDVHMTDLRPTADLRDVFNRWEAHAREGFGDGIIVATSLVDRQHDPSPRTLDQLELYARRGDRWLRAEYLVGTVPGIDRSGNEARPQLAPPEGWPIVDAARALELVRDIRPHDAVVVLPDVTHRYFAGGSTQSNGESLDAADMFPGSVWPTRERLNGYLPTARATLTTDEHTGERTVIIDVRTPLGLETSQTTTVTLPASSPYPTMMITRTLKLDGSVRRTERYIYRETMTLADGKIVPARWRFERDETGGESYRSEASATFAAGLSVPDRWWQDPANWNKPTR